MSDTVGSFARRKQYSPDNMMSAPQGVMSSLRVPKGKLSWAGKWSEGLAGYTTKYHPYRFGLFGAVFVPNIVPD